MPQTYGHRHALLDSFSILPVPGPTPSLTALVHQAMRLVEHEEFGLRAVLCLQNYQRNVHLMSEGRVEEFANVVESEVLTNKDVLDQMSVVLMPSFTWLLN